MKANTAARIRLAGNTKLLEPAKTFPAFLDMLKEVFAGSLPEFFKIVYNDPDGDLISVSNQEDYEIACESLGDPRFEFVIQPESDLRRSSNRLKETVPSEPKSAPSIETKPFSNLEEESKAADKKPDQMHVDSNIPQNPMLRFEKGIIEAESVYVTNKKEDSIVKEPLGNESDTCFACKGTGLNKKRKPCKKCEGSGKMNASVQALKKHFEKVMRKEVTRAVQEEFQRQSSVLSQSKRLGDVLESIAQSSVIADKVKCTVCETIIKPGESIYYCAICPYQYFCEDCEDSSRHPHALIKSRAAGERNDFKMELIDQTVIITQQQPGSMFNKIWTIRNKGKKKWPKNTELVPCSGDDLKPRISAVGEIEPGAPCDIVATLTAPNGAGNYKQVFQLSAHGKKFGDPLVAEFHVEEIVKKQQVDEVDKMKRITFEIEKLKKTGDFAKKYEDNVCELMKLGDWSAASVLRVLMNNGNDITQAANELYCEKK